jgi:chromosomal replication initiation ATPase DnaA
LASQLPLPLPVIPAFGRDDFILSDANRQAVAFIDAWPDWSTPAAALHGPSGSGKTHLAHVWAQRANALTIEAPSLVPGMIDALSDRALVIENIDATVTADRDDALFALLNRRVPVLFTGREAPVTWPTILPDLASRFRSMLSFGLWAPDDKLLAAIAQKLFFDRQLAVPESVVSAIVDALDRSPDAIRRFVAEADARALAEKRPVNLGLIRELLAKSGFQRS